MFVWTGYTGAASYAGAASAQTEAFTEANAQEPVMKIKRQGRKQAWFLRGLSVSATFWKLGSVSKGQR